MIKMIRAEKQRKLALLIDENPNFAGDRWTHSYESLFNDLCLMLLVSMRHELERELVCLGARVTGDESEITEERYQQNLRDERKLVKSKGLNGALGSKLKLASFPEWNSSMKTLRLLVNLYKHDPNLQPDEELLKHLGLDIAEKYAQLPESTLFLEGLASSIDLPDGADYCDVAERFLSLTKEFLEKVKRQAALSRVSGTWLQKGFDAIPR